jgi:hypothetical protein
MKPTQRSTTPPTGRRAASGLLFLLGQLLVPALLILFVAVTFGPALLGHGVLIDVDILSRWFPFAAHSAGPVAANICRGDTIDYYLPGVANIRDGVAHGQWRMWSPYEVGGAPLAGLPNHAVLSPLSWPYWVLPLWLAPAWIKLTEFIVVIAGMTAFLGRLGVRRSVGAVAGLIFFCSGFMVMWTNWPHTRVAALIPALFWAIDRTVTRRRPADAVLFGAVVASMLLGGFPAVTLFSLTAGAVYAAARALPILRQRRWRSLAGVATLTGGGVALGVALAGVQIVPFVRNLSQLGLEDRNYLGHHAALAQLATLVAPEAQGTCVRGFILGDRIPIEAVAYVGIGAVALLLAALVPAGLRRTSSRPPVARWALAGLLLATGTVVWFGGPALAALQVLPFYSTNSITRATCVVGFLVSALAGIGLERILGPRNTPPPTAADSVGVPAERGRACVRLAIRGALCALVVIAVLAPLAAALVAAWRRAGRFDYRPELTDQLVVVGALSAVALFALALAALRPRRLPAKVGAALLVVVVAAQGAMFVRHLTPVSHRANFYPQTPTHEFLTSVIDGDRYGSGGGVMYPATSDWYHLRTAVGHEFTDQRWADLLTAVDPTARKTATFSDFRAGLLADMRGNEPVLDRLAVRWWVAKPQEVYGKVAATPVPPGVIASDIQVEDNTTVSCTIPAGALRGIQLNVVDSTLRHPRKLVAHLRVTAPDGTAEGERQLLSGPRPGALKIGVPGETLTGAGPYRVDVRFTGSAGPLTLAGADGAPRCTPIRPEDDGLRLAFSEPGSLVYERLDALPRIRWAANSTLVEDPAAGVARLHEGLSPDTVLLEDADASAASGLPGDARVIDDAPDRMVTDVTAEGDGYLVVADSIVRDGWTATIDGRSTPLLRADHALAAVVVPAGEHRVIVEYHQPGLRAGLLATGAALLTAAALLGAEIWLWLRRRRDRRLRRLIDRHEPGPAPASPVVPS